MKTANNAVAYCFVCLMMLSSRAEKYIGHTISDSNGIWVAQGTTEASSPDRTGEIENISQNKNPIPRAHNPYRHSATSLISCWPEEQKVQNGRFEIKQNLQFIVKCKPNYTRALASRYSWKCNDTYTGPIYPTPVACLEINLPVYIYLEADVKVHLTDYYTCDADYPENGGQLAKIIKRKGQKISIDGFKFVMNSNPTKGCSIGFDKMGSKVDVFYHFVLQHKPNPRKMKLPKTLLNKTRTRMQQMVLEIMEELKAKEEISKYNITLADKFKAGPCSWTGAIVEAADSRFDTDLPICRACPAGWYLNRWEKICRACGKGLYSDMPGATGCTYCPTAHEGSKSTTATRKDCYDNYSSAYNRLLSIRTGAVMFILSTFIYVAVLSFHVRNEISKIIKRTARHHPSRQY